MGRWSTKLPLGNRKIFGCLRRTAQNRANPKIRFGCGRIEGLANVRRKKLDWIRQRLRYLHLHRVLRGNGSRNFGGRFQRTGQGLRLADMSHRSDESSPIWVRHIDRDSRPHGGKFAAGFGRRRDVQSDSIQSKHRVGHGIVSQDLPRPVRHRRVTTLPVGPIAGPPLAAGCPEGAAVTGVPFELSFQTFPWRHHDASCNRSCSVCPGAHRRQHSKRQCFRSSESPVRWWL